MWEKTKDLFLQSMEKAIAAVADFLPAVLAMVAVLLLSIAAAVLVRVVLRRLLVRVHLDQRLRAWGMAAPASQGRADPSAVIARFSFWTVIAFGFLAGLSAFATTSTLASQLLAWAPKALAGLVIFIAGLAGSRVIERSVLIGAVNAGLHSARLLGLGARWLVLVLSAAMALEQFGLGGTVMIVSFAILFGGIVLALSLAVGLGARETVARSLERVFSSGSSDAPKEPLEVPEKQAEEKRTEFHHM